MDACMHANITKEINSELLCAAPTVLQQRYCVL